MGCANTKASASAASISRSGTEDAVGVADANKPSQKPPKVVIEGDNGAVNGSACQNGHPDGDINGANCSEEIGTDQLPQVTEPNEKEKSIGDEEKQSKEEEKQEEDQEPKVETENEEKDGTEEEKPTEDEKPAEEVTSQDEVTPEIMEQKEGEGDATGSATVEANEEEPTEPKAEAEHSVTEEHETINDDPPTAIDEEPNEETSEEPVVNGSVANSEEH